MFFGFEVEEAQQADVDEKSKAEATVKDCESVALAAENTVTSEAAASSREWNSWTSGFTERFLQTVKQTTATVADAVKQDLSGIAKGLLEEDAPKTAEEKAKQSAFENALDSLDDGLEKAEKMALTGLSNLGTGLLNVGTSLFAASTSKTSIANQQTLSDRFAQQVLEAAIDQKSYLEPFPAKDSAAKERYQSFTSSFDQVAHAGKIALLIDQQPGVLTLMKKLVPKELSEEDFWKRYYFKVSELELDQKTRSLIVASNAPLVSEEQEVAWSDSSDEEKDPPPVQEQKEKDTNSSPPENHREASPAAVEAGARENASNTTPLETSAIHKSQSNSSFDIVEAPTKSADAPVATSAAPKEENDWDGWE